MENRSYVTCIFFYYLQISSKISFSFSWTRLMSSILFIVRKLLDLVQVTFRVDK